MLQRLQGFALGRAFTRHGSKGWLILGTAAWLLRKANETRKPEVETIYRGALEPGDRIEIDHLAIDQGGKPVKRRKRR